MCLNIDESVKVPKSNRNYFIGYKAVTTYNKQICPLYQDKYEYMPGVNVAKGTVNPFYGTIGRGAIHVFLNKKDAIKELSAGNNKTVIPVRCYYKDVIKTGWFCGMKNAAMKQVYLDKRSYDKAVRNDV